MRIPANLLEMSIILFLTKSDSKCQTLRHVQGMGQTTALGGVALLQCNIWHVALVLGNYEQLVWVRLLHNKNKCQYCHCQHYRHCKICTFLLDMPSQYQWPEECLKTPVPTYWLEKELLSLLESSNSLLRTMIACSPQKPNKLMRWDPYRCTVTVFESPHHSLYSTV